MLRAISVCLFAVLAVLSSTPASAQTFDNTTHFTFSQPVALPGVTLPPGKYTFRIVDTTSSRRIVQVLDAARKPVAMLMSIPELSGVVPGEPAVRFTETRAGVPYAVDAWWYPGNTIGRRFIYPKEQRARMAN
jgi:hypothetical protein